MKKYCSIRKTLSMFWLFLIGFGISIPFSQNASADVIGFIDNPTTNSADWSDYVIGLANYINTNLNFDTHPIGDLQEDFYLGSDGITLSTTGSFDRVSFGEGPNNGNDYWGPLSQGEGVHNPSNYLREYSGWPATLTISFNQPVYGVGFSIIDLFNPSHDPYPDGYNNVTIEVFSGANGTGTSLGLFDAANYNFQNNYSYFMGIADTEGSIGSLIFNTFGGGGDSLGVDDILYASNWQAGPPPSGGTSSVPEPASMLLFGIGFAGLVGSRLKRKKQ